jgi:tRNA threonylcarbamoyladenosine biosynthesis protein TsaB
MNLLALETSSSAGSVALATDGRVLVRELGAPREQTEQILALTDALLREAGIGLQDLHGITFGRGPGSFTGLRVSAAVAQGLAAVHGTPLLPVSSLLCLGEGAWRVHGCERALVCVDAHMGEVYWAMTERRGELVSVAGDERLAAPAEVVVPEGEAWCAVGSGLSAHAADLAHVLAAAARALPELKPAAVDLLPQARRDLAAGRAAAPTAALPVYLREHTAWRRSS